MNDNYIRFVRLTGHFNSANKEFHIVEFEVHDTEPPLLESKNVQKFDITSGIPGTKVINELIDNAISSKLEILTGVDEKMAQLQESIKKSDESLKHIELIKKSHDFQSESQDNKSRSNKWLIASSITLTIFLGLLIWFVFCDKHSKNLILELYKNEATKEYTTILLSAFYVTKAFLLSTILFILTWCLKNYRSEKHNYVINKHKAMSLTVATSILSKKDFENVENAKVFNQATEIIFSHQNTGYSKEEESTSPNMINAFLQKSLTKTEL